MIHLIDDFTDSAVVTRRWSAFSDRVMGGVSTAQTELLEIDGRQSLRLHGRVSLERNGGFIQVARRFPGDGLDGSAFGGLQLHVCGAPGPYFVHVRTADTRAPWQYYAAPLSVLPRCRDVYVPWGAFTGVSLDAPLDVRRIERLGFVAAKEEFDADLVVSRVELVP